ncbi:hypothetical protein PF005_g28408 [Phytophthora fragariae]|uniref:Uncharacterized protein n=4 Tax=Phytophthora fragariae TaxID=53985 RepID=A0A6A3VMB7_9STRA|nr:hypothetical protein PF003_g27702 [Phytophthora fragariae]KAE8895884.1 hypothetical protein PF003_g20002 [Phytophthora fragariae]KAE8967494.1 hypothetical protein PF011_g27537 [Phytophthora fragariae]KAE9066986.1 hypothetical protein PF007_g28240 [Phytophthora fragariae]KAE9168372.1 hypothetical protein PF005_g28408 [Phytophthora fragariae]
MKGERLHAFEERRPWGVRPRPSQLATGSAREMEFVVTHRVELTWVACGLLLGAVLAPLHGLVTGPFCAGCDLVYKWTGIVRRCFKRYRSYMISPEVQDAGTLHRWWMLSESLLGTPMIELVVQDEHQHGHGRVAYKFCDAFHA